MGKLRGIFSSMVARSRVQGSGFRVRVKGLNWVLALRVQGVRLRDSSGVSGSGFRVRA